MERLNSYGWLFIFIAMAGDLIVSFILSLFYRGYSNFKMSISALGNPASPVRIPFNIWMLIEGVLFLLAIPSIYKLYHEISGGITITMIIFIVAFAVGSCILTCFFSVNESKEVVTPASKIHGAGSVIGVMLFLFVPLLIASLSFKGRDKTMGIISIICFVAALAFFTLFVISDKPEFKKSFVDNEGLWQRLNLLCMYLPLAVISVKKLKEML